MRRGAAANLSRPPPPVPGRGPRRRPRADSGLKRMPGAAWAPRPRPAPAGCRTPASGRRPERSGGAHGSAAPASRRPPRRWGLPRRGRLPRRGARGPGRPSPSPSRPAGHVLVQPRQRRGRVQPVRPQMLARPGAHMRQATTQPADHHRLDRRKREQRRGRGLGGIAGRGQHLRPAAEASGRALTNHAPVPAHRRLDGVGPPISEMPGVRRARASLDCLTRLPHSTAFSTPISLRSRSAASISMVRPAASAATPSARRSRRGASSVGVPNSGHSAERSTWSIR